MSLGFLHALHAKIVAHVMITDTASRKVSASGPHLWIFASVALGNDEVINLMSPCRKQMQSRLQVFQLKHMDKNWEQMEKEQWRMQTFHHLFLHRRTPRRSATIHLLPRMKEDHDRSTRTKVRDPRTPTIGPALTLVELFESFGQTEKVSFGCHFESCTSDGGMPRNTLCTASWNVWESQTRF